MSRPSNLFWRWEALVRAIGKQVGIDPSYYIEPVWDSLTNLYGDDSRHYHNLDHIRFGLDVLDRIGASLETKLAWFFHDVIYVAGSKTNEADSADFAERAFDILGLRYVNLPNAIHLLSEVQRLIMLTVDHKVDYPDKNGGDIVTADLYGLAASEKVYDNNTRKIRLEFGDFTDREWRAGRKLFLEGRLLRNVFPYGMDYRHLESAATRNMQRELLGLTEDEREELPHDEASFIEFMTQPVSRTNGGFTA